MDLDFNWEPDCVVQLSSSKERPVVPHDVLHGPALKTGLGKHDVKGEDKFFEVHGSRWELPALQAATGFSAFGIFDGHGGKHSATVSACAR